MTDSVMVALPRGAAQELCDSWHGDHWVAGVVPVRNACREALDRPSLPEGTPQVGWSLDGYPLVWSGCVPDGWERRNEVLCGPWRSGSHGLLAGHLYAVRPAPQPATERIPWWVAVNTRRTAACGLRIKGSRWDAGLLVLIDEDEDEIPGASRADDGTVEVLVEP